MSNVTLVWGTGANLRGSGVSRKVIEWRLTVFLQEGRKGRMDAGEDDAVDEEQTTLEIDRHLTQHREADHRFIVSVSPGATRHYPRHLLSGVDISSKFLHLIFHVSLFVSSSSSLCITQLFRHAATIIETLFRS